MNTSTANALYVPNSDDFIMASGWIVTTSAVTLLYAWCMYVLYAEKELFTMPVYKIMFCFGIFDIIVIVTYGIMACGIITIVGGSFDRGLNVVFCGTVSVCWMTSSILDDVLAFNRFVLVMCPQHLDMFKDSRVYYWPAGALAFTLSLNIWMYASGNGDHFDEQRHTLIFSYTGTITYMCVTNITHIGSVLITIPVMIKFYATKRKQKISTLSINDEAAVYQVVVFGMTQVAIDIVFWVVPPSKWTTFGIGILTIFICGQLPFFLLIFNKSIRTRTLKFLKTPRMFQVMNRVDDIKTRTTNNASSKPPEVINDPSMAPLDL